MTGDLALLKRRRDALMAVNALAVLVALAAIVGYFRFDLGWAPLGFAAAILVGLGAQIWFIAGLKGPKKGA